MKLTDQSLIVNKAWIAGSEVDSADSFAVIDPATQEVVANVADCGAHEAEVAIAAAQSAFYSDWGDRPSSERSAALRRWADHIDRSATDLANIICSESGKPILQARGEVAQCAELLRWFAAAAERIHGATLPVHGALQRNYTIKEPIGVVACITPWNFPAAAVIVKAGAALVCGNTVVAKPSEETPLIALALARLSERAELDNGVFNVLPCANPSAVGRALCESDRVRMLSFTGSTTIGRKLYSACGSTVKRLALELGGNAPFVVFDDADIDRALDGALGARFYNSGQICVGANRFLIEKGIYAEFAARLGKRTEDMRVGPGTDEGCAIGPLINRAAVDRLTSVVAAAVDEGAQIVAGGGEQNPESLFFDPIVLTDMTSDMDAYRQELFGPVACLYAFDGEEAALKLANDTSAGLAAYVYTEDSGRLERITRRLEAGVVGANSTNIFSNDLPFGGVKQSGLGREHGFDCLDEYLETKSVCLGL